MIDGVTQAKPAQGNSDGGAAVPFSEMVRQNAQNLIHSWRMSRSAQDAAVALPQGQQHTAAFTDPIPAVCDSGASRGTPRLTDMLRVAIPPGWDEMLSSSVGATSFTNDPWVSLHDGAVPKRRVFFHPHTTAAVEWSVVSNTQGVSSDRQAKHNGHQLVADTASVSARAHNGNYGLSKEEMDYFGLSTGPPRWKPGTTPKEKLLARLRQIPSLAASSPRTDEQIIPQSKQRAQSKDRPPTSNEGAANLDVDIVAAPTPSSKLAEPSSLPTNTRGRSATFLRGAEKPINQRFSTPGHCDATSITTCVHMLAVTKAVMSHSTAKLAERDPSAGPIHSIDMSHTTLGKQGRFFVPTQFGAGGSPMLVKYMDGAKSKDNRVCFWPDERLMLAGTLDASGPNATSGFLLQACIESMAERSLALAYVAPLLYLVRPTMFHITKLVACHCDLTDADARALSVVFTAPAHNSDNNTNYECYLQHLDLSSNYITNTGAHSLKKAIKYITSLTVLHLSNNRIDNSDLVLNEIKRRLRNNRKGITNLGTLAAWRRRL